MEGRFWEVGGGANGGTGDILSGEVNSLFAGEVESSVGSPGVEGLFCPRDVSSGDPSVVESLFAGGTSEGAIGTWGSSDVEGRFWEVGGGACGRIAEILSGELFAGEVEGSADPRESSGLEGLFCKGISSGDFSALFAAGSSETNGSWEGEAVGTWGSSDVEGRFWEVGGGAY